MKYAFIDYENVNSLDGLGLQEYDRIFLFVGAANNQMDIRLSEKFSDEINITLITVQDIAKNNVDFHLAYYLGKLDVTTDKSTEFHIFSKDKGYDGICHFIQNQRDTRLCFRKIIDEEDKAILSSISNNNANNAEKEKIAQVFLEYQAFMAKNPTRSLPVKRSTLQNSIHNQTSLNGTNKQNSLSIIDNVINKLAHEKLLKINENKVSY